MLYVLPARALAAACLLMTMLHGSAALAIGKYDARDGDECRAQVNANFDAIARDRAAHGNYRGIASMEARGRSPALRECEQMDQDVRQRRMSAAYDRLATAIETLRTGGAVSDAEKKAIADDYAVIVDYPEAPYREACLGLHAEFLRYAMAPSPSADDCPAIRAALRHARGQHDAAIDALLRRGPDWREQERARQAALQAMKWREHLARRAACQQQ